MQEDLLVKRLHTATHVSLKFILIKCIIQNFKKNVGVEKYLVRGHAIIKCETLYLINSWSLTTRT